MSKQGLYKLKTNFLITVDTAFLQGVKKLFRIGEEQKELVDPYFLMNFAGKEVGVYETYLAKFCEK